MDLNTVKLTAREKFKGVCRVCPSCNGVVCAGEVPGMGGRGTGAAFRNNVAALADYRFNLRVVHDVSQPKLSLSVLGIALSLPIIGAPIAGIGTNMNHAVTEQEYDMAVVTGCCQAGSLAMTGDGSYPEQFECGLAAVQALGGMGIPVIKPRETGKVIELAKRAADAGAPAFGMDIDAAGFFDMANVGQPVGPKTQAELAKIKEKTSIPFIVKGIMTPDDAAACMAAGVDAIVVSNHGGRALDHVPGTAEVLPLIAEAVQGKITILADGGVRSGGDVLKMLALGADAVLVGRPLAIGAVGGQAQGVELVLKKFADELRTAMILTGTADAKAVSQNIIC
ncbi:MAG: alpha-hydroxy-acid oxidizing protein [Anaerolineaceae bacterium]|nr:alpha-hydroxy-acid oxidizing protein [Anaerolineaceae bacterium]